MTDPSENRASRPKYVSQHQLVIEGFESPFEKSLNPNNRWVRLAKLLPWDELAFIYRKHFPEKLTGRPSLSPRLVLGAIWSFFCERILRG